MNLLIWMLVQWTSKVCPFHISKNLCLGSDTQSKSQSKIPEHKYYIGLYSQRVTNFISVTKSGILVTRQIMEHPFVTKIMYIWTAVIL